MQGWSDQPEVIVAVMTQCESRFLFLFFFKSSLNDVMSTEWVYFNQSRLVSRGSQFQVIASIRWLPNRVRYQASWSDQRVYTEALTSSTFLDSLLFIDIAEALSVFQTRSVLTADTFICNPRLMSNQAAEHDLTKGSDKHLSSFSIPLLFVLCDLRTHCLIKPIECNSQCEKWRRSELSDLRVPRVCENNLDRNTALFAAWLLFTSAYH